MPKVRWVISYAFVANFLRFPAVQKFWKSVKISQSYREFKGGNFLRHSVLTINHQQVQMKHDIDKAIGSNFQGCEPVMTEKSCACNSFWTSGGI